MIIDQKHIEDIAKLARIRLTEEEKEKYVHQFSAILNYIDQLNEVDTKDIEPYFNFSSTEIINHDEVRPFPDRDKILAEVPETKDKYIKVKKVL